MRLTPLQLEVLASLAYATGRACDECLKLEAKGLVVTGQGRFGTWAKLTADGRQYLARKRAAGGRAAREQVPAPAQKPGSGRPAAPPGPAPGPETSLGARQLLRGAVPRQRRNTANHARGTASISPPEAVQNVGGTHSKPAKPRGKRNGA